MVKQINFNFKTLNIKEEKQRKWCKKMEEEPTKI